MATASKGNNNRKKKTNKNVNKGNSGVSQKDEIILWIVLACSILLFISNIGVGGAVGNAIGSIFFGLFGLVSYVFPICLFVITAFTISNKSNKIAWIKIVSAIFFLLFMCFFIELVITDGNRESILDAFTYGKENKSGGGFFGGMLVMLLYPAFGLIGAYVIDIVGLIVTLVLITERSIFKGMQKGGEKVYQVAKDENARLRVQREERKVARRDRKVSGVAMDTVLQPMSEENTPSASRKRKKEKISEAVPVPSVEVTPTDAMSEINIDDILNAPPIQSAETVVLHAGATQESVVKPVTVAEVKPKKQSTEEIQSDIQGIVEESKQQQPVSDYVFPPVSLLNKGSGKTMGDDKAHLQETANKLQQTLKNFGVNVTITNVSCGPSVTRYELQPEMGVKVSKIVNLADDIKLNLAAADIRIEAPIPGKAAIGIEVPNKENVTVAFRDLIESSEFQKNPSGIAFAAGKDISGQVIVADIAKMPHVLIAGATGSGKSVCINTIIMSILYKADPKDVKLIMIDPKVVELSVYNGIPHLFVPVVTDPKKASGALHWAVTEMDERYRKFAEYGVRDLKGYNQKVESIKDIEDETKPEKMPQIVIIVDELADLMMVAPGEVEDAICRLAQLARAAGIHLIIATQRPSVNVITGLIKANMPSRVAFAVTSGVDSRTILDMNGAEKLLGKGDMLFYPQGYSKPLRVQGAFVSDKEVQSVVQFVTKQNGAATYDTELEEKMHASTPTGSGMDAQGNGDERDAYFADAARLIMDKDKGSIGMLQRYFKIGFNRAARIMDQLEEAGIVGPEEGTKPRRVIMSPEQFEQYQDEYL